VKTGFFADLAALEPQQIWDGLLGRTVHGERVSLSLVEFEPSAIAPEHSHPNEQIGMVVEGQVTFTVAGETKELGPGGTWRILAGVPHSAVAGSEGAVVVEVFSPIRDDWSGLAYLDPRPPRWP
jgi:unsaturated pyranuronate lyase